MRVSQKLFPNIGSKMIIHAVLPTFLLVDGNNISCFRIDG